MTRLRVRGAAQLFGNELPKMRDEISGAFAA
jgi:hypothetical protein